MNKLFCTALIATSITMTSSSSSAADPIPTTFVEFRDPTEVFKSPPPTKIALGELLSEADLVAVVWVVAGDKTKDCEVDVLRAKKICAVRENWHITGMSRPQILHDAAGDDFLIAVRRLGYDIFSHGDDFDHDAYDGPTMYLFTPFLYFGKVRPVTQDQAAEIQEKCPKSISDGDDNSIELDFKVNTRTPIRAIQGQRGAYPLFKLEKMAQVTDSTPEELTSSQFKYLIQTYGSPDASPLVQGVNLLLEALAKEKQEARQALGSLSEDEDPVTAAAAKFLLGQEKLPRFQFNQPIPLPSGN